MASLKAFSPTTTIMQTVTVPLSKACTTIHHCKKKGGNKLKLFLHIQPRETSAVHLLCRRFTSRLHSRGQQHRNQMVPHPHILFCCHSLWKDRVQKCLLVWGQLGGNGANDWGKNRKLCWRTVTIPASAHGIPWELQEAKPNCLPTDARQLLGELVRLHTDCSRNRICKNNVWGH